MENMATENYLIIPLNYSKCYENEVYILLNTKIEVLIKKEVQASFQKLAPLYRNAQ